MYYTSLIGQWQRMTVKKQLSLISFMASFLSKFFGCEVKYNKRDTVRQSGLKRCYHQ